MKNYEVTWLDSGKTKILTLKECERIFGDVGFSEIVQGYAPHIVAIDLENEKPA